MNLPSYDELPGAGIPNPNRSNKKYKEYRHPDSQGNPGKWHIYWNGEPQFIADPQPSAAAYSTPPPAPAPVAPAPPPASSNTGGTQAPAEPKPAGPGSPQPTTGAPPEDTNLPSIPQWFKERSRVGDPPEVVKETYRKWTQELGFTPLTNNGKKYVVSSAYDSKGNLGIAHNYEDGTEHFIDKSDTLGTIENPRYYTNDNPSSSHYGQKYLKWVGQSKDGVAGEKHIYSWQSDSERSFDSDFEFVPYHTPGNLEDAKPIRDDFNTRAATVDIPDADAVPTPSTPDTSPSTSSTPASTEPSVQPASVLTGGPTHTVVQGDTMWDIAQANNVSLDDLKAANPQIADPNLIHPGEQINIPGAAPAAPAPTVADSGTFPTTSSYLPSESDTQANSDSQNKQIGWADTGNESGDPIKNLVPPSSDSSTDPLKINKDKGTA